MRGKLKRKFAVVMASVLALSNIQTAPVFAAVEEERTKICGSGIGTGGSKGGHPLPGQPVGGHGDCEAEE